MTPRLLSRSMPRLGAAAACLLIGFASPAAALAPDASPPAATETDASIAAIPAPGSATSSPETAVTITGADASAIGAVTATGSESGPHQGRLAPLAQGPGVTFTPEVAFTPGETVEVTTGAVVSGADGLTYSFTVGQPAPHPGLQLDDGTPVPSDRAGRAAPPRFSTRPDLRPPGIDINVPASGTAPGLLFATPRGSAGAGVDQGVLIYDDAGEPVWFHPVTTPGITIGNAFVATYAGAPALVWFEGTAPFGQGSYRGEWVVVDSTYREVARVAMGNGYHADLHDIRFTDRGSAYLMAYNPLICTGAPPLDACVPGATVLDGVVQEVDVRSGQVLWEWHSLDHIPLTDSYVDLTSSLLDYFHINSIDLDEDGDVLLSARVTSALYKIDRESGDLLWIFGGKRSSFPNLVGNPGPTAGPDYPHDVVSRGGGSYSWFDNGTRRGGPSRGHIVSLDPSTGTATYTTSLERSDGIFAPAQGNMQPLPGGGNLLSWGGTGVLTEFDASGQEVFDTTLTGNGSYRQFRDEWTGAPATSPVATAGSDPGGTAVAVSWNGDTRTRRWRILGGEGAGSLSPLQTVDRSGFETTAVVAGRPATLVVEALDAEGQVIGRSAPVAGARWFSETAGPSISGTYQPLVGDFGGTRNDDIIYYRPGPGPDFLHTSDGSGGFSSTLLPAVNGDYTPLVGDFVGDDRDEVLWTRAGSSFAALWRFDLGPRTSPAAIRGASLRVPATVSQALVLGHRRPYGGGADEVLFYAAGSAPDSIVHLSWPLGGALSQAPRVIAVNGTYSPVSGDFDGNGQADVLWYAPGPGADFLWLSSGNARGSTGHRSVPVSINGSYQVFSRNFRDAERRDEVAFFAPGPGPDSLWSFDAGGGHVSVPFASPSAGFGLALDGGTASLMPWLPGSSPDIIRFSTVTPTSRPSGNTPVPAGYEPIIGDFVGPGGVSSVLWYAPGPAPERLDIGS